MSLELPRLGFGGAPIGNLYATVDEPTAAAAVQTAWRCGWRYFDTAPHYGLGLSEERLGRALADFPRESYLLSTKVGRRLEPSPSTAHERDSGNFDVPARWRRVPDFSFDGVTRTLADSLHRLQVEHVDIAYLHDPEAHVDQTAAALAALGQLKADGRLRAVGVGTNEAVSALGFVAEHDIDVVMIAGRYTLLEQGALDELLPACLDRGVAVVAAGVFNSGLLASQAPAPGAKHDYRDALPELIDRARQLAEVCTRHDVPLPAAALQFPAAHPAVINITVGCRSAAEVEHNARLSSMDIPAELWVDLKSRGFLRPDAPTPPAARQ